MKKIQNQFCPYIGNTLFENKGNNSFNNRKLSLQKAKMKIFKGKQSDNNKNRLFSRFQTLTTRNRKLKSENFRNQNNLNSFKNKKFNDSINLKENYSLLSQNPKLSNFIKPIIDVHTPSSNTSKLFNNRFTIKKQEDKNIASEFGSLKNEMLESHQKKVDLTNNNSPFKKIINMKKPFATIERAEKTARTTENNSKNIHINFSISNRIEIKKRHDTLRTEEENTISKEEDTIKTIELNKKMVNDLNQNIMMMIDTKNSPFKRKAIIDSKNLKNKSLIINEGN